MTSNLSYVHQESGKCFQSELDLFLVPPTTTQVEKSACISYQPISSLSDTNVIEFFVAGTGEEYIDLSKTKIYIKARIVKKDGTAMEEDLRNQLFPVNNWLHSLFSQVDVFLNDRLVNTSNNLYPYRAYLESLLNYGDDAMKSQLTCQLFYKDNSKAIEKALGNEGAIKRRDLTYNGRTIDMIGTPCADIFNQNRYLINNVDMKLRFIRHNAEFCLMSPNIDGDLKVIIEQATLFIHKVKISPSTVLSQAAVLQGKSVKYPIRRVEMKSFSISKDSTVVNRDNIVLGQLPTRVIVGLVNSQALNGDIKLNPFNFLNSGLNYLSLSIDSEQLPSTAFTPDFKNKLYMREYQSLFEALGIWRSDRGLDINREEYETGYTLYAFDLTPTQTGGASSCGAFNLLRQGNLKIDMRFAEPLKTTVTVILYLTYENMLEIDSARNVVYDFST